MNDIDLLNMAAKAAGVDPLAEIEWGSHSDSFRVWGPLDDDGDALHLAVKLRLNVYHANPDGSVTVARAGQIGIRECTGDEQADTRRAIVRAAAEIGKAMP